VAPAHVGFVGLGRMGRPMAARLLGAGFGADVFDAQRAAGEEFVARHGGTLAPSLAETGRRSDVVITMLPDGETVRRVVAGDGDALLAGLRPGAIVVDMGSSAPLGTAALGRLLGERGIGMLDAPVSGGVPRAETGTLSIMVGGEPALVERCRPLLETMGNRVFATGPLGSGHAVKALNNLVSAAGLVAAAEALLVGRRFGVDPEVMLEVFNASTARNNSTELKFRPYVFSRTFASGFALDLMVKDLGTALELAASTGTPVRLADACHQVWRAARDDLGTGADHTEVVRWLEQLAGTTLARGAR
jgi:3-hydroxyisobutyrate dehydrogenase